MRNLSLLEIADQIDKSLGDYYTKPETVEWRTMDSILGQACSNLSSRHLRHLIPQVILVDSYYGTNLIKYLDKPDNKLDFRFGYYKLIAQGLQELKLDEQIKDIQGKARRLCASNLEDVAKLCNDVSDVVKKCTNRTGIVFASKLLHFNASDLFPIIDNNSENKLKDVLTQLDDDANKRIHELRANIEKELLKESMLDLWYENYPNDFEKHYEKDISGSKLLRILEEEYPDCYREYYRELLGSKPPDRYARFAMDILCLQQAICLAGRPMYSLGELDRYLYGSRFWQEEAD